MFCSHVGCMHKHSNHKWGRIKAVEKGWVLQKNGQCWCPDHVPSWVKDWRYRKK